MKRIKQFERTDRDITNALLLLLEKNRFEKITVAQIIEEAGINRSTFYQHFSDKYEIVERLQAKYLDEFVAVAQSIGAMENPDLNDYAIAMQAYFQKNRSILKKIFSIQSSSLPLKERIRQYLEEMLGKNLHQISPLEASLFAGMTIDYMLYYLNLDSSLDTDFINLFFQTFYNMAKNFFRLESPEAEEAFQNLLQNYSSRHFSVADKPV